MRLAVVTGGDFGGLFLSSMPRAVGILSPSHYYAAGLILRVWAFEFVTRPNGFGGFGI